MTEFGEVFALCLSVVLSLILIGICFFLIFACVACIYGMCLDIRKWIRQEASNNDRS
jgi:TRAP-type mannitol/chloroaromatic compound transport system permease small subunit